MFSAKSTTIYHQTWCDQRYLQNRTGLPMENLYSDDLSLTAKSVKERKVKVENGRISTEERAQI